MVIVFVRITTGGCGHRAGNHLTPFNIDRETADSTVIYKELFSSLAVNP